METDRISVLPDEVLVNILSCLPTRYAIQTSVLSNRWRYLWTFKPNLEFLVEPHNATTTLQEQQVDIINHCLDNYKSNTLQTLDILLLLKGEFTLDVERWIRFAARRGVVELHMRCGLSKVLINLPRELFSCKSLSSLVLWNSLFDPPLDFNGFSNLKLLEIVSAFITDKTLHNLLVTCPLLEDLTLRCCPGLKILNISSSILKKLVIYDCFFLEKLVIDAPNISAFEYEGLLLEFRLINVPHLLEIDLQIKDAEKFLVVQDWRLVISKIAHVKFLTVGCWFSEFIFAEYYVNNRPRTSFINLKEFRWSGHLLSRKVILAIVTFLEDCPLLEKVYIDLDQNSSIANYWNRHHNLFVEKWIPHSQYAFSVNGNEDSPQPKKQKQYLRHFEYSFHHLKTIEMVGFSGKKKEMDLVKFLLTKSVVLDMFVLTSSTENVNRLPNRILQERLSRLPKASLCADVVLFEPLPADFLEEYTASA